MNEAINFCCECVQDHPCLYYRLGQETFHIRNTNISTIIFLEFLIDDVSALEQVYLNVSFLLEHVCFSSFCCQVFWEGSVFEWQALLHYREGTTNRPHVWHHYYIIIWYPPTLLCSLGSSVMQCSPLRLRWLLRYLFTPLMCLLIKHLSKAAYFPTSHTHAHTHTHTHTTTARTILLPGCPILGHYYSKRDAPTCRELLPAGTRTWGHQARWALALLPNAGQD